LCLISWIRGGGIDRRYLLCIAFSTCYVRLNRADCHHGNRY
jgi:hypothetical protein